MPQGVNKKIKPPNNYNTPTTIQNVACLRWPNSRESVQECILRYLAKEGKNAAYIGSECISTSTLSGNSG